MMKLFRSYGKLKVDKVPRTRQYEQMAIQNFTSYVIVRNLPNYSLQRVPLNPEDPGSNPVIGTFYQTNTYCLLRRK